MELAALEERLAYNFAQRTLLEQAVTHRSHGAVHNERLEFLGDAVLNCAIAQLLFAKYARLDEGDLSRLRANLVKQQSLADIAEKLVLSDFLRLGEGEMKSGGFRRPSILADTMEAIFGAIFVDSGFDAARTVIGKLFDPVLKTVDPKTLKGWLAAGDAVLIDVREPGMHAAERIAQARSIPLGSLDAARLPGAPGQRVVFQCEIGGMSATATQRAMAAGRDDVYNLAGGISAWKDAGFPIERSANAPLPIIRQVQIVAGSLVVLGTVLGATLSPWFLLLSGFVGAGLVFAGSTGICGMAACLMKLPHNRRPLAS